MYLIYLTVSILCLVSSSGNHPILIYHAKPNYFQYVSQNNAGDARQRGSNASIAVNDQSPRPEQNSNTTKYRERPNQWAEPIVLITVAYVVVAFFTLLAIVTQGKHLKKQSEDIASQVNFMRLQWEAVSKQANLMERQLTEIGKQTRTMSQQTYVLWEQAKMTLAKEMARVSVDLAIKRFNLPMHIGWSKHVGLSVRHFGLTEAFNVSGTGVALVHNSRDFPIGATTQLIPLPDVLRPKEDPTETYVTIWPVLTVEDADAIRSERSFFHAFGDIRYNDFLGGSHVVPFWYTAKINVMEPDPILESVGLNFTELDFSYWEVRSHPELQRQIAEYKQHHPNEPLT